MRVSADRRLRRDGAAGGATKATLDETPVGRQMEKIG